MKKLSDALYSDMQGNRINEKHIFFPELEVKDEVNLTKGDADNMINEKNKENEGFLVQQMTQIELKNIS